MIDELAVPAAQIQNHRTGIDVAGEKLLRQDLPDLIAISDMRIEPATVKLCKFS
jgi:hypothetical protein